MHANAQLIETFYTAFQRGDAAAMARCYHPDVLFSDEVFPKLAGARAGAMWAMLLSRGTPPALVFDGIEADGTQGRAHWVATYHFSKTGRRVVNDIHAQFTFADGLIVRHVERFDFYRWSRMALGTAGVLLGWTPFLRAKVQREAGQALDQFVAAHLDPGRWQSHAQ